MAWAIVSIGMFIVLGIAAWLTPAEEGMGTHEALGLPPCSMVITSGLPCPTCGMTTAFSHSMRGQFVSAFVAQPTGLLLWLATVVLAIYGLAVSIRGRALWINWDRIAARLMLSLGILMMLGWGFKIAWGMALGTLPMK